MQPLKLLNPLKYNYFDLLWTNLLFDCCVNGTIILKMKMNS